MSQTAFSPYSPTTENQPETVNQTTLLRVKYAVFTFTGFHLGFGIIAFGFLCYFITIIIMDESSPKYIEAANWFDNVSDDPNNRTYKTKHGTSSYVKIEPREVVQWLLLCSTVYVILSVLATWCLICLSLKKPIFGLPYQRITMVLGYVCVVAYVALGVVLWNRLNNLPLNIGIAISVVVSILMAWLLGKYSLGMPQEQDSSIAMVSQSATRNEFQ